MRAPYIGTLDSLRGIAALLVVVFHLRNSFPSLDFLQLFLRGYLWVDLFFLLSGFILAHVYSDRFAAGVRAGDYGRYAWARFSRIYPLHVVMLLGFVLYEVSLVLVSGTVFPDFHHTGFDGTRGEMSLLTNLLLVQSWHLHDTLTWNYPAWSISTEMLAYLVFPFLVLVHRRLSAYTMAALALTLWLVLYGLADWRNGSLDIHYDWGLVRCLAGFGIGMVLYRVHRAGRLAKTLQSDALLGLCILSVLLTMQRTANDAFVVPLFAVLLLAVANNTGRIGALLACRPLSFLGEISYSIYLVHALVIQVARKYWFLSTGERFGRSYGVAESWAVLVMFLVLIVLIATLTHRYIEKPAMRALRNRVRPRPPVLTPAPQPL